MKPRQSTDAASTLISLSSKFKARLSARFDLGERDFITPFKKRKRKEKKKNILKFIGMIMSLSCFLKSGGTFEKRKKKKEKKNKRIKLIHAYVRSL